MSTERIRRIVVAAFFAAVAGNAQAQQELFDIVGKTKPDIVAGSTASR